MYPKIDIYISGIYACSTCMAKNTIEAKKNFVKNPQWMGLGGIITAQEFKKIHNLTGGITCKLAK